MLKRILALLAAVVLLSASISASAHDVPDFDRRGSISVSMYYRGQAVPGGTLSLHRVGDVVENNGDYSFAPAGEFADSGLSYDVLSASLAQELARHAAMDKLRGETLTVDKHGQVVFTDLEPGLYLIEQRRAATGYNCIAPFLIGLPGWENEAYVYDLDATPKLELTLAPPPTPSGKLPQTGQLNWPVPVLAASGLFLFVSGWFLFFAQKKERR